MSKTVQTDKKLSKLADKLDDLAFQIGLSELKKDEERIKQLEKIVKDIKNIAKELRNV